MCSRYGEDLAYWIAPLRSSCGRSLRGTTMAARPVGLNEVRTAGATYPMAGSVYRHGGVSASRPLAAVGCAQLQDTYQWR
jgi:hypothetical protein